MHLRLFPFHSAGQRDPLCEGNFVSRIAAYMGFGAYDGVWRWIEWNCVSFLIGGEGEGKGTPTRWRLWVDLTLGVYVLLQCLICPRNVDRLVAG